MNPNALIPSMFHRRLTLLVAFSVVGVFILTGRLYVLTVVQGAERRDIAESVLTEKELLPTARGRILDRNGEELARNEPCFDLLVDYSLISGEWVVNEAWRAARQLRADDWAELSQEARQRVVDEHGLIEQYEEQVESMWRAIARISGEPYEEIEAKRRGINERVERTARHLWEIWRRQREEEYQIKVSIEDVDKPIREQRQPHVILSRIPSRLEADLRRFAASEDRCPQIRGRGPGVTLRPSGARDYPWREVEVVIDRSTMPAPLRSEQPLVVKVEDVDRQLVGRMRDRVYEEDVNRRPLRGEDGDLDLGGYIVGDHIGADGVEAAMERDLRGRRGQVVRSLDTGAERRTPPEFGRDVELTLDIRLQARIAGLLDPAVGLTRVQPWHGVENNLPLGAPLDAGVVVLDIQSSEVLAAVSSIGDPDSLEPFLITPENSDNEAKWWSYSVGTGDPLFYHKGLEKPYPPGSIVKPLMLCSGVSGGVWTIHNSVDCQGHFFPNLPDKFRCWIYRPPVYAVHGPLGPTEAIARSCNIYFYTIARSLGAERLIDWYHGWGIGRDFNLGVNVSPGLIKNVPQLQGGEIVMMGIGQGPVAWTPLHAASAYATLARGGYFLDPLLIRSRDNAERYRMDLALDDQAVFVALQGLHEVVNNQRYGGARQIDTSPQEGEHHYEPIFNEEGIHVWGKTGTAQQQWPTRIIDYTPEGEPVIGDDGRPRVIERESGIGAHSWFVGLAGPDAGEGHRARPKYAIAVLVEWGGSGSRCAGPIANQVVHTLVQEGYLP